MDTTIVFIKPLPFYVKWAYALVGVKPTCTHCRWPTSEKKVKKETRRKYLSRGG